MTSMVGMRRSGRVCVAAFDPPDASVQFEAWKQTNRDRFGPKQDWQVSIGRHISGRDWIGVWVLEEHAHPAN
jgi:hypothetical protein